MALTHEKNERHPLKVRILQAAAHVFGRSGYQGACIRDVAAEAGITKPTVYKYFKNKMSLYEATLKWVTDVVNERQKQAASGPRTLQERILAVLRVRAEIAREYADLIRVVHSSMFAPDSAQPRMDPMQHWRMRLHPIEELVEEGVRRGELQGEPADIALVIVDTLGALTMAQALFPSEPILVEDLPERLWKVIYHGAKRRPGPKNHETSRVAERVLVSAQRHTDTK